MQPSRSPAWIFYALSSFFVFGESFERPYEGAQNYWPLTKSTSAMTVIDVISGANGNVHKAVFIPNIGISGAVSFSGDMQWIDFPTGQFKSACIENPESCQFGFTIAFWIRFKSGTYIMSTGAFTNSSQGTGIKIIHVNRKFSVTVRTQMYVWEVSAKAFINTWCHIVIRWSSHQGLQIFLDGNSAASDKHGKSQRIMSPSFSKTLTIARPPNLTQNGFGKFDLAHLAVWLDHLIDSQISQLGDLVLETNGVGQYRCGEKNVSCTQNPCGWKCNFGFPDAVCLNIKHKFCPEILKELTTVRSNTTQWSTQSATKMEQLTNDVAFTPTALSATRPSRNSGTKNKGIATLKPILGYDLDNIYSQAIHYIGVRESELVDLRGNSRISVAEKPRILLTNQLGKVVTVNKPQNCIAIQDMKFRCIKNPSLCEKTGFTFALWLRNRGNNEQYIAYGIRAHKGSVTGFTIHHKENGINFTVKVRTRRQQWEAIIHKMPYSKRWWHLLITWSKQSGITLYINGNFAIQRGYAEDIGKGKFERDLYLASEENDIVVGCTNGTENFIRSLKEVGQFDFGHLAIWSKVLSQSDIEKAYKTSITETRESIACCKQISGHDCITLPCHKFQDPGECESLFGNDNCLCKEKMQPAGRCHDEPPLKHCGNSRKYQCARLASQTGYCNYYQAEMEKHCPVSCNLCDGLYRKAAHYFKIHSNHLIDDFASSKRLVFPTKLNIKKTNQLGDVISLNSRDFYVDIKGFQRECVTDPNVCSDGLSVAFWLHMADGKHIIAGGRYRDEPRGSGFIILHDSNSSQFRIEVVTSRNKWTAVLHKIPFTNQWFHLVFTWSVTTGLRISVNGQFLLQDAGAQERKYSLGSVYEDNGILIGGKDPSNGKIQNVKFEMGHLAIWDYALDPWDIQLAYKETIKKNTLSIKCCHELSANKCVSNVCYKFRAPERCEAFFNQKKCLCPETRVREKCKTHTFKGECWDKRADCKVLASQNGYCDYYRQEMEKLCPLSCQFCPMTTNRAGERKATKMRKEVLVFALIGCAAGIILLFLISLYSWKVYRSKFTGAFIPSFKAISSIEVDEYGEEKWTKYIDSSYFVIKDVPPKKRALPAIPIKPPQPKYQPPDFQ